MTKTAEHKTTVDLGFTKPVGDPKDPTKKMALDDAIVRYLGSTGEQFSALFGCPLNDVHTCLLFYVAGTQAMRGNLKDPAIRQRMLDIVNTGFDSAAEYREEFEASAKKVVTLELKELLADILHFMDENKTKKPGRKN